MSDACRCGCSRESHRHYRYGSDCSYCGCRVYRRPGWLRRFLDRRGVRKVRKAGRVAWAIHQAQAKDREAS